MNYFSDGVILNWTEIDVEALELPYLKTLAKQYLELVIVEQDILHDLLGNSPTPLELFSLLFALQRCKTAQAIKDLMLYINGIEVLLLSQ